MHLILFLFFIIKAEAKDIVVTHRFLTYKIRSHEKALIYSGPNVELSLVRKSCNDYLFKRVQSKLYRALRGPFLEKETTDGLTLTVDKVKMYDRGDSKRAAYFGQFDSYFKALKMEEMLSCKENKL